MRKAAVPVTVEADGIGRYRQDAEAAVYFSCLEGLQNVAKYADASHAVIRLSHSNGGLTFEVQDDGRGFDSKATSYGTRVAGHRRSIGRLGRDPRSALLLAPGQRVGARCRSRTGPCLDARIGERPLSILARPPSTR